MATKKRRLRLPGLTSDRELLGVKHEGTGAIKPGLPGPRTPLPRIDAADLLARLGEIRSKMPFLQDGPPRGRGALTDGLSDDAFAGMDANDFEWQAVAEGLSSLAEELGEAIEDMQEKALREALKVYYAAEDMLADPEQADEIRPHYEKMRQAYTKEYGVPPPKREDADRAVSELLKARRRDRDRDR
jgi:hypothetical protein